MTAVECFESGSVSITSVEAVTTNSLRRIRSINIDHLVTLTLESMSRSTSYLVIRGITDENYTEITGNLSKFFNTLITSEKCCYIPNILLIEIDSSEMQKVYDIVGDIDEDQYNVEVWTRGKMLFYGCDKKVMAVIR